MARGRPLAPLEITQEQRAALERWARRPKTAQALAYLTVYNEDPKPFVWTKTADEILAKVGRFAQRISDSGH